MTNSELTDTSDLTTRPPTACDFPSSDFDEVNEIASEIVQLAAYDRIPDADGLHLAVSLSHRLILSLTRLEGAGVTREQILPTLARVRAVHAQSPFVRRLQEWPRGYPGDFETVEYLLRQRNHARPGGLPYWLEHYALHSSIAQQHRNKVDRQARVILDTVLTPARGGLPRMLILAAGGSPDLRQIETVLADHAFSITLLDQDADALEFSANHLQRISDRLVPVKRNVVRGLPDVARSGRFDLVLAGGLFDYLPDKIATLVLRVARERLLVPGGRFVFTNVERSNAFRPWIEYLGNWCLIHRSAGDVRRLCHDAGFAGDHVTVEAEPTGLTLIVSCQDLHR